MTAIDEALARLRAVDPRAPLAPGKVGAGFAQNGVGFAAVGGPLESRWRQAVVELAGSVGGLAGSAPVLSEGGPYRGSWIEGTGTVSTEVLSRFVPAVARATHLLFAGLQREDGLIPYKVTDAGPGFSQIQIVSPLARSVWIHYALTGLDTGYLRTMYDAMSRNDAWLARYRDTRGTGGVEAFCAFDTGHDLSPRFWFAPDRCLEGDPTRYDSDAPNLPYLAPDLTANVACQRSYLARIAAELGEDPEPWADKARASLDALWRRCYDAEDEIFYDVDRHDRAVTVQSDVLLRVLACEVGDEEFFRAALERYLMNTGKFLSHFGFTSLAMDDPRFDHDFRRNSWGGPVNFLSLIRAPAAFEMHGHVAELATSAAPTLSAVASWDRFPQCLDPWSGEAGYAAEYTPAILWLLDAVERNFGILPAPDGSTWFSGLAPTRLGAGAAAEAIAYRRTIDGIGYELGGDDRGNVILSDGVPTYSFPRGWRLVANRRGEATSIVGLSGHPVSGVLRGPEFELPLTVAPNERVQIERGRVTGRTRVEYIAPRT